LASALMASRRTVSGNQPAIRRLPEEAGQTFLDGTPVQLNGVDGGVQAWDGVTVVDGIAGFAKEAASNLAATGTNPSLTTVGVPTTGVQSTKNVPNQPLARTIYRGVPYNDTRVGFEVANSDTVFFGEVGPNQTPVNSDVGKSYGMTKDTDGHWYVDRTKTGAQAVVTIVKLDYADTARGVQFQVLLAAQQISPA
jgi:hypothetical protein